MLFSGNKLVLADQSSLGQIKRKVGDISLPAGIAEESLGTVADPHVFLAYIRDHRVRSPDLDAFRRLRTLIERRTTIGGWAAIVAQTALRKLKAGDAPFERFTNLADGKKWGKYYNSAGRYIEIKPVPPSSNWWDSVKGAVQKIGAGIVWFGEKAWEFITSLCARFIEETDSKRRREAAVAVISAAASPAVGATVAAAVETARKICKGVAFVDAIGSGAPDAPTDEDVDTDKWGRIVAVVAAVRAQFVRVAAYPQGSFAVYDPATSKFMILAPGS